MFAEERKKTHYKLKYKKIAEIFNKVIAEYNNQHIVNSLHIQQIEQRLVCIEKFINEYQHEYQKCKSYVLFEQSCAITMRKLVRMQNGFEKRISTLEEQTKKK